MGVSISSRKISNDAKISYNPFDDLSAPALDGFTSQWDTTNTSAGSSNSDQVTLPITSAGTFDTDWGDGNQDSNQATHTYAAGGGVFTIIVRGQVDTFRFNNTGDRLKILNISQWDILKFGNLGNYFHGCGNLDVTATDTPDLTGMTSLAFMFFECFKLVGNSSFNQWDTALIEDYTNQFGGGFFYNQPMNDLDYTAATNMDSRMSGCISYNVAINWITPALLIMDNMMNSTFAFNSSFLVTSTFVTTMKGLFRSSGYNQLFLLDTSSNRFWDDMFRNAASFDQEIGSRDVKKMESATNIYVGSGITRTNYDTTLIGIEAQVVLDNVPFNAGTVQYSAGASATARANLISDHSWTITDGGQAP